MQKKVVTRFAPSPTGYLHLGGARTALYSWMYARSNEGKFILRIEDTDVTRSTKDSADAIIESLKWLGIDWDEGPIYQSDRLNIYASYLKKMRQQGFIYPAFDTKEELDAMRTQALSEKKSVIYNRAALKISQDETQSRIESGEVFVWRFKVPEGVTEVNELLMGDQQDRRVRNETIGDFIITRPGTKDNPGMPLFNFVVTVDDALMGVTHIMRGIEHLPNAPKQVLLAQAMGFETPHFVHLPIVTKNNKKMSKRDKDADGQFPVSVLGRKNLGYLAEATLNQVALLGWSSPDEKQILSTQDMIPTFSLERLHRSNAAFDEKKYLFFNAHYIGQKSDAELVELTQPFLKKAGMNTDSVDPQTMQKLMAIAKPRSNLLSDIPYSLEFFFTTPATYDSQGVEKFFQSQDVQAADIIRRTADNLGKIACHDKGHIEAALTLTVAETGVPYKTFGPILRLALTGKTQSPSLSEMIDVLEPVETFRRLKVAAEYCDNLPKSNPAPSTPINSPFTPLI